MTIIVNTRKVDHVEGESISRLLKRMKYMFPLVVVKLDGKVIPRDRFTETIIHDDANVEVMHLISGG